MKKENDEAAFLFSSFSAFLYVDASKMLDSETVKIMKTISLDGIHFQYFATTLNRKEVFCRD